MLKLKSKKEENVKDIDIMFEELTERIEILESKIIDQKERIEYLESKLEEIEYAIEDHGILVGY